MSEPSRDRWRSILVLAAPVVISKLSFTAMGIVDTTLVGRHQGEGASDLAFAAGQRTVVIALGFTALCGLVFASIPGLLARAFTPEADVQHLATTLITVAAAVQIFDGLNIVSYGALKGAGDTRGPLIIVVVMNWLVGVPLVYLLTISAKLGALGAWIGMLVLLARRGGLLYARFRSGKWRGLRVVQDAAH